MSWTNGDIAKIDLTWNTAGIGMSCCIFQCRLVQATPHVETDANVLLDLLDWIDSILLPIKSHIVTSYVLQGSPVYKKVGALWNYVGDILPTQAGESIGDPLPSGVAALIEVTTDTSRVMGKKYLPGFSELAQTAGLWVSGVLAALASCAMAWAYGHVGTHTSDTSYMAGVWSVKAGGFKQFTGAGAVNDVPAYQRRRKAGVGA